MTLLSSIVCQDDLVFGFDFDFRLQMLTFSYERSRATKNTQAKTLAPTKDRERQKIPKQKHSLLQSKRYTFKK